MIIIYLNAQLTLQFRTSLTVPITTTKLATDLLPIDQMKNNDLMILYDNRLLSYIFPKRPLHVLMSETDWECSARVESLAHNRLNWTADR